MARFVLMKKGGGGKVAINPERVTYIRSAAGAFTDIFFEGQQVAVEGTFEEVVTCCPSGATSTGANPTARDRRPRAPIADGATERSRHKAVGARQSTGRRDMRIGISVGGLHHPAPHPVAAVRAVTSRSPEDFRIRKPSALGGSLSTSREAELEY